MLQEEITVRESELSRAKLDYEVGQETVLRLDDEILQLRQQLSELEHTISSQQQRSLELKSEADRHESKIEFNQQRCRSCRIRMPVHSMTSPSRRNARPSPVRN